jgi:putative phage-type endonuclease
MTDFDRVARSDDRPKWLKARMTGIGASEAAAVLGEDPWCSPYTLWAKKTGRLPEQDDNEAMEWGRRLEDAVAEKLADETGRVVRNGRLGGWLLRSRRYPFLLATPDREWTCKKTKREGLGEIKTTSAWIADRWEPGTLPAHFQFQGQQQLAVTERKISTLAVLIGGQRFVWKDYARHERFIRALITKAEAFWKHVTEDVAPPLDASESTFSTLTKLREAGSSIELPRLALDWHDKLVEARARKTAAEGEIEGLKQLLASAIGTAPFAALPDGKGFYKFSTVERSGYTVAPTSYRELRYVKKIAS